MKTNLFVFLLLLQVLVVSGQDPHFTQYHAAPFSINPAYTGIFNGRARFISNHRQQWASGVDPFITTSASLDMKLKSNTETGQNPFNIGLQLMNDKSLKGAFRSSYVSATSSFHASLDADGIMSLGAGLMATYANRRLDLNGLFFDNQFTSGGFLPGMASGETSLQQLKPYFTIGAGMLFNYNNPSDKTFFELGASIFNANRPIFTTLQDSSQFVPVRYSLQASLQKYLGDQTLVNLRGLYQSQASVNYILTGLSVSKLFGPDNINQAGVGFWYRTGDAFSPYLLLEFSNFMVGCSYDITISSLKDAPKPMRSFELSLTVRMGNNR
jgi:type IX secretion system PorP/SprF family membrane protein